MANAARRDGFWEKAAVLVRDLAGAHAFRDGNKRTALAVVTELMRLNQVLTGVSQPRLQRVIAAVAKRKLTDVREITRALRGS